jgi:hypothetical protein
LDGKICGLSARGSGPRRPGPPWTGGHCRILELIGAQPSAAQVAGVVGRGAEEGKESTGVIVSGSPGFGRRRSGGASAVKATVGRALVWVTWGSKMGQGGAVGGGDAGAPFYRVSGGAGRPGVRGEWAVMVVHHNGGGGGPFRRGSAGVVVGSDEVGCSGRYESGRGTGRRRARARVAAAVATAVVQGGRRSGGARMSSSGGGWPAGLAGVKVGTGPTQEEEKNPFQISFKFCIW